MLLLTCHAALELGANASDMMVNRRVWRGNGKRLGLREHVGNLAVHQPGKVRAGSLAVSDLEYDEPWHVAGQLDGDAAAVMKTSIGVNVSVSGNRIRMAQTVVLLPTVRGEQMLLVMAAGAPSYQSCTRGWKSILLSGSCRRRSASGISPCVLQLGPQSCRPCGRLPRRPPCRQCR